MASPQIVHKCLNAFASNYGKSDRWVDDTLKLWARGLNDIHDKDLIRGTEEWCRKKNTPPNLARLRDLIDGNPKTTSRVQPDGCPACDGTGWREMARWYQNRGKTAIFTCVAACDCMLGVRLSSGGVPQWDRVAERWRNDGLTDQVFHSTAEYPHLTTEQRMTPEQLAAAKERAKRAPPSVKGWTRVKGNP